MNNENEPMDLFESTVFKPSVERRSNDSMVIVLMQQVHEKIEAMDKKLTQHMVDETSVLAEEIAKLMNNAFPGSDPMGHRKAHEAQMEAIADRAAFWKMLRNEIAKYGIVGLLGWITYSLWMALLRGPTK